MTSRDYIPEVYVISAHNLRCLVRCLQPFNILVDILMGAVFEASVDNLILRREAPLKLSFWLS